MASITKLWPMHVWISECSTCRHIFSYTVPRQFLWHPSIQVSQHLCNYPSRLPLAIPFSQIILYKFPSLDDWWHFCLMAALYLHNAIHTSEPSNSSYNSHPPHNRNVSTVSSATLHTSTSEYSHPTEPLLRSSTSIAYLDLLSRQPSHPSGPQAGWTTSLSLNGDPVTERERKDFREHHVKQRLRLLKRFKSSLEFAMGRHCSLRPGGYWFTDILYRYLRSL